MSTAVESRGQKRAELPTFDDPPPEEEPAPKRRKAEAVDKPDEEMAVVAALSQEEKNAAFLARDFPPVRNVWEATDPEWATKMWFSEPYTAQNGHNSRRVDCGPCPPTGKYKTPPRMRIRIRGRFNRTYGYEWAEKFNKHQFKLDIEDPTAMAQCERFNEYLRNAAFDGKWAAKNERDFKKLVKDRSEQGVRVMCTGPFKQGKEKEQKDEATGESVPFDPPQYWPMTIVSSFYDDELKKLTIKDQHDNVVEASDAINGCAAIVVADLCYVYFMNDKIGLTVKFSGIRINTDDCSRSSAADRGELF